MGCYWGQRCKQTVGKKASSYIIEDEVKANVCRVASARRQSLGGSTERRHAFHSDEQPFRQSTHTHVHTRAHALCLSLSVSHPVFLRLSHAFGLFLSVEAERLRVLTCAGKNKGIDG